MPKLPPLDKNVNHAPHVVLLGAGASIAAYLNWGKKGPRLPSMQDLVEVLSLRTEIQNVGYETDGLNFEAFYDDLSSSGKNEDLIPFLVRNSINNPVPSGNAAQALRA